MNFNFPVYSDFHKFVLVDELALCKNPALIHYGKCSVIGFLLRPDALGSLSIPNLQKHHQIPDCSFTVNLTMNFTPAEFLNTTVEIFGEVRLYDTNLGLDSPLESSHSLIKRLRDLQTELEKSQGLPSRPPSGTNDKSLNSVVKCQLQKEIEGFKKCFKAIVQVYTIRHVQDARGVIAENLQFRLIQAKRKARLSLK